eukprot:1495713-Rhodomonas_salina.3
MRAAGESQNTLPHDVVDGSVVWILQVLPGQGISARLDHVVAWCPRGAEKDAVTRRKGPHCQRCLLEPLATC